MATRNQLAASAWSDAMPAAVQQQMSEGFGGAGMSGFGGTAEPDGGFDLIWRQIAMSIVKTADQSGRRRFARQRGAAQPGFGWNAFSVTPRPMSSAMP